MTLEEKIVETKILIEQQLGVLQELMDENADIDHTRQIQRLRSAASLIEVACELLDDVASGVYKEGEYDAEQ